MGARCIEQQALAKRLPPLVCEKGDIDVMVERLNQMIEA